MKTIITLLLMALLFLGGVLIGMDQANEGIIQSTGNADDNLKQTIQTGGSNDEYAVTAVDMDAEQIRSREKEERYEELPSTTITQKAAAKLEHGVKWFYNQVIFTVYQLVQAFF